MKVSALWGPLMVLLLHTGCATEKKFQSTPTGDPLVDGAQAISSGPPRDRQLWQYRTASAALRRNNFEEARRWLDDALLTLESVPAGDKSAKKSRGYFSPESKKSFRGEPYERAMAYYYRGVLYWMDGQLDNARACFRSAQLQDSDTEQREYANDHVLLEYLDGLITSKLGGDGNDAFQRALTLCKWAVPPALNPKANTIFFIEFGPGPTKYASGRYQEELRFRTQHSVPRTAAISIGSQIIHVGPYDDLNFQATTRGGRVMDHILANKAVFKTSTDIAGDAAIVSGLVLAHGRGTQEAALGAVAVGVITKIISGTTTPEADTRAWDNLPQFLTFASLNLPEGEHHATVEFLDGNKKPIPALTKRVTFKITDPTRDKVLFVSDQSVTPQNSNIDPHRERPGIGAVCFDE